jgi:thimet oligopeptidase
VFSWNWPIVPWFGGVEQDFLEVPSMMFEQWMEQKNVLNRYPEIETIFKLLP